MPVEAVVQEVERQVQQELAVVLEEVCHEEEEQCGDITSVSFMLSSQRASYSRGRRTSLHALETKRSRRALFGHLALPATRSRRR